VGLGFRFVTRKPRRRRIFSRFHLAVFRFYALPYRLKRATGAISMVCLVAYVVAFIMHGVGPGVTAPAAGT
jgi:hypothetical protein